MITIKSVRDLKRCPPGFVYVKMSDRIFNYIEGEWIEKRYFSGPEVLELFGLTGFRMSTIMERLKIRGAHLKQRRYRITHAEMMLLHRYIEQTKMK